MLNYTEKDIINESYKQGSGLIFGFNSGPGPGFKSWDRKLAGDPGPVPVPTPGYKTFNKTQNF